VALESPYPTLAVTVHDTGVTIAMVGDLDMLGASRFSAAVDGIVDQEPGQEVTLDLSQVGFCDSVGIGALVALRKRCDQSRWPLRIIGTQPAVRRLLVDYTGLGEFLNVI
jgi:anti-anti-sigma factor